MSASLAKALRCAISSSRGVSGSRQFRFLAVRPAQSPSLRTFFSSIHLRSEAETIAETGTVEPSVAEGSDGPYVESAFSLRPYQKECIQDCLSAIQSGVTRIGVSSPTGSGKTTIFTHLVDRIPPRSNGGNKVLIIVSSIELALQAADAMTAAFPEKSVEIEQGRKYIATGHADVTVATYQTLHRNEERLQKLDPATFKAVVIDEAHHAAAPSYLKVLAHFDPTIDTDVQDHLPLQAAHRDSEQSDPIAIVGFSATFSRHDGLALSKVFDRIVFHKDFLEMIGEKWLCPIRFTSIKANIDLTAVKLSRFDFAPSSLAAIVNTPVVNRIVLRAWIDKAYGRRKSTLVFAVNIEHVQDLTETFRQAGVDARFLHGGTPMPERRLLLQDFRNGVYPVLVNCAVLTEGADVPSIDCVLLARPTRSRNLFSQMIGRGLRLSPKSGKKDCLVLDVVGNVQQGVVCTPTLFGLSVDEVVDNETSQQLLERLEQRQQSETLTHPLEQRSMEDEPDFTDPTKITYIDYADPHQLQQAMSSRFEAVETMSPYAWVDCGDKHYVLQIPAYGHLQIERTEDTGKFEGLDPAAKWVAKFFPSNQAIEDAMVDLGQTRALGRRNHLWSREASPFRRPRHVLYAATLEAAIRGCDQYVKVNVLVNAMPLCDALRRTAKWRKESASVSQTNAVRKRLGIKEASEDDLENTFADADDPPQKKRKEIDLSTLTKGQAATLLTRLKHGAKARWQKKVKAANKEIKRQARNQARLSKETVRVGPLA